MKLVNNAKVSTFAHLCYDHSRNTRNHDDYGTLKEMNGLRDSIINSGYLTMHIIVGELATKEEIDAAVEERQAEWNALKEAIQTGDLEPVTLPFGKVSGIDWARAKVACFEYLYVNDKGKLIKPTTLATTGHRRGTVILDALAGQLLAERRARGDDKLQPGPFLTIEVNCQRPDTESGRFPDEASRMTAQIHENETKNTAAKKLSHPNNLRLVSKLIELSGVSQTFVRKKLGFSDSTGLRYYYIAIADNWIRRQAMKDKDFKGINLLADILTEKLDFGKFTQGVLQKDGWRFEIDSVFESRKAARLKKDPNTDVSRFTAKTVKEWIVQTNTAEKSRAPALLKRDTMQNIKERNMNPLTAAVMAGVLSGESASFESLSDKTAPLVQAAMTATDEQIAKAVEIMGGEMPQDIPH